MSLFPRNFYGSDASFTPLFRLLDDFDNYRTEVQGSNGNGRKGGRGISARTFNPKFDVRETENTYELHGELPGIERENVSIEFTEPQTLVIHGHVERTYQSGNPPSNFLEGGKVSGAITEGGERNGEARRNSHQPTVEDEPEDGSTGAQSTTVAEVAKSEQQKPAAPKAKYWVSERSIGEFSRTFNFPTRVETEEVQASLNNGVLAINVPKAKKHESRRIAIN